jgi:hypothetical protein
MRLRGPDKITASKLLPGQSITATLRVRAGDEGRYRLTSPNFSYLNHTGHPHRETGFAAQITVDPAPVPAPEPNVIAELMTAELPIGEWSTLRGRISNVGDVDVSELKLTLSGQVSSEERGNTFANHVPRRAACHGGRLTTTIPNEPPPRPPGRPGQPPWPEPPTPWQAPRR